MLYRRTIWKDERLSGGKIMTEQTNRIKLTGFKDSWENFFEVIKYRKTTIERRDGKSMGNFWAFIQHLESSYKDIVCGDCGFKDSCEPVPPPESETDINKVRKFLYDMYEETIEAYRKAWEQSETDLENHLQMEGSEPEFSLGLNEDFKQLELDRFYVSLGMRKQAGGFFKGIGDALGSAHPSNVRIIRKTWNKEWNEFLEIGKIIHEKENE